MVKPVVKAVFPVAGLGTRFLPATKSVPKEMLPVVDKPLIQYALEEARDAGIEEFVFVAGRAKSALEDHFDHSIELEHALRERGKGRRAPFDPRLPAPARCALVGSPARSPGPGSRGVVRARADWRGGLRGHPGRRSDHG